MMSAGQTRIAEAQNKAEAVRQPGQELARQHEQRPVQLAVPQAAYRRAQANPSGLAPADLLVLQRTAGNHQLQRMLARRVDSADVQQQNALAEESHGIMVQAKPTVGAPDDVYEREAGRVAGQVMTMPDAATQRPNQTGLPDGLKSGIESLSGIAMDNVNVHYNSSKPAQLNALAYAPGSDTARATGQEKHQHQEEWHVEQRATSRVRPPKPVKDGILTKQQGGLELGTHAKVGTAKQLKGANHDTNPKPADSGADGEIAKMGGTSNLVQRTIYHISANPKQKKGTIKTKVEDADAFFALLDRAAIRFPRVYADWAAVKHHLN